MNFNRSIVLGIVLLWAPCIAQAQPNNELEERCRKQAEELFHQTFKTMANARFASFENHYSHRFNRCFYLLRMENNPRGPTSMWLRDLDKNGRYHAAYVQHRGSVTVCRLGRKYCRSEEEWREMIKPFMQD
jgi:hypothetical protein